MNPNSLSFSSSFLQVGFARENGSGLGRRFPPPRRKPLLPRASAASGMYIFFSPVESLCFLKRILDFYDWKCSINPFSLLKRLLLFLFGFQCFIASGDNVKIPFCLFYDYYFLCGDFFVNLV